MHVSLCVCTHGVCISVLAAYNLGRIITNFILVTYLLPPREKKNLSVLAKNGLILPSFGLTQPSPIRGSTQKKAFSVFIEFYLGHAFTEGIHY